MADPATKRHYWLYVLKLENNKYYVGRTSRKDPHERIREHVNGFYTAQWLKKYPLVQTAEIIDIGYLTPAEAEQMELHRTIQYMRKYGTQDVRGGKLNYSGKYVKIGSYFWRGEDFSNLMMIIFILLVFVLLGLRFAFHLK